MSPYRFSDSLFPLGVPDALALPDARLDAVGGIPENVPPQLGRAVPQQKHNRRAAVFKIALFLPAEEEAARVRVADAPDEHRAHLDLRRVAERAGAQQRDGARVFLINIIAAERDGVDRVQHAGEEAPPQHDAVVKEAVAVVIAHRQPENQAQPAAKGARLRAVAQQRADRIRRPLDEKQALVVDRIRAQPRVGGRDQRPRVGVERTAAGPDAAGEEIVEALVVPLLIIPHIDAVFADEAVDQPL